MLQNFGAFYFSVRIFLNFQFS